MTREFFKHYTVYLVSGIAMVALGSYIAYVGADASPSKASLVQAGAALAAVGGILLSWTGSQIFAPDVTRVENDAAEKARGDAQQVFNLQLATLSRNVGQAASQINLAVQQGRNSNISAETAFALVSQASRNIYQQINEIAVLRGEAFDSAYLVETATKLGDLAIALERTEASEDRASVRQQIAEVRTDLTSKTPVPRSYSTADASCPYCGQLNMVELGDAPGDTKATACQSCRRVFNSHRSPNGTAITRQMGTAQSGAADSQVFYFNCPNCGAELRKAISANDDQAICLTCNHGLRVTSPTDVSVIAQYDRMTGTVVAKSGNRPMVECPTCHRKLSTLIQLRGSHYAWCHRDHQIFEVTEESFTTWCADDATSITTTATGVVASNPIVTTDGARGVTRQS